jgi:hypothetical protein
MTVAPFMPKATAKWLVEYTSLSFQQIADFCQMHPLEIQGIADGDVAASIAPNDPIKSGLLTKTEIERCEKDEKLQLKMNYDTIEFMEANKKKGARYTPIARRQDKPDAVSWLLKNHPELSDGQIIKLIGTTKSTIEAVRSRTHWNINNLNPRDPVLIGLCTQSALNDSIEKAEAKKPATEEAAQG